MKIIRMGLLALCLPLLLAAAPSKMPARASAKAATKSRVKPAAKTVTDKKPAAAPTVDAAADAPKSYPLQTIAFPGGVTMTQMVYRSLPGFRPLTLDLY